LTTEVESIAGVPLLFLWCPWLKDFLAVGNDESEDVVELWRSEEFPG